MHGSWTSTQNGVLLGFVWYTACCPFRAYLDISVLCSDSTVNLCGHYDIETFQMSWYLSKSLSSIVCWKHMSTCSQEFVLSFLHCVEGVQCSAPRCRGWPHQHHPLLGFQDGAPATQQRQQWSHHATLGSSRWPHWNGTACDWSVPYGPHCLWQGVYVRPVLQSTYLWHWGVLEGTCENVTADSNWVN